MKTILFLIFFLLPVLPSSADEWILIGNSLSGDTFYVDEDSVDKKQKLSTVKEKQIFKFNQLSQNGSVYNEAVLVKTYNCSDRTFSLQEATGYDSNGKMVFSEKLEKFYQQNPDKRWTTLGSNSMFSKSFEIACR